MTETRLESLESRLSAIETDVKKIKIDIHKSKQERMIMNGRLKKVETNTIEILSFVDGGKKVFGFARKNWKTALTFGLGLTTAAGIGNPKVTAYIQSFFGLM